MPTVTLSTQIEGWYYSGASQQQALTSVRESFGGGLVQAYSAQLHPQFGSPTPYLLALGKVVVVGAETLAGKTITKVTLRVTAHSSWGWTNSTGIFGVYDGGSVPPSVTYSNVLMMNPIVTFGGEIQAGGTRSIELGTALRSSYVIAITNPTFPLSTESAQPTDQYMTAAQVLVDVEYTEGGGGGGSVSGDLITMAKAWTLNDDGESVATPGQLSVSLLSPSGSEVTGRVPATFTVSGNTATLAAAVTFPEASSAYTVGKVAVWSETGVKVAEVACPQVEVQVGDAPKLEQLNITLTALSVANKVLRVVFLGEPLSTHFPDIESPTRTRKVRFRGDLGLALPGDAETTFLNAANVSQAASGTATSLFTIRQYEILDSFGGQLYSKPWTVTLQAGAKVVIPAGGLHA